MNRLLSSEAWLRPGDNAKMRTDITQVRGGIVEELYIDGQRVLRTFSKRPYTLGQACDGTIDVCVLALFISYCQTKGLDPQKLYHEAYSDVEQDYFNKTQQENWIMEAKQQGVIYPKCWGRTAYDGLLESLTEINNHSLRSGLEDLA